ncbi:L domain-like protein [Rozella allomycis CSF55]|uniref:Adenylate cyclase n=1 Tax=Rozella allomycis (strain CSF55) TaxID=988480 RepID=A0A4P9YQF3_ROZAC|nr:L domain-like protein [Rozella allomycis CSF55]
MEPTATSNGKMSENIPGSKLTLSTSIKRFLGPKKSISREGTCKNIRDKGSPGNESPKSISSNPDSPRKAKKLFLPNLEQTVKEVESVKIKAISSQFDEYNKNKKSIDSGSPYSPSTLMNWLAPESWMVRPMDGIKGNNNATILSLLGISGTEQVKELKDMRFAACVSRKASLTDDANPDSARKWEIRVFKPATKSTNVQNATYSHTVVKVSIDTTVSDLIISLSRKFNIPDNKRFGLYIQFRGQKKQLDSNDFPIQIQFLLFQSLGYSLSEDDLSQLALEDHSFYFKFIFQELENVTMNSDEIQTTIVGGNMNKVDMSNKKLNLLSVKFYESKFANSIHILNLGGNSLIHFDFLRECKSLVNLFLDGNDLTAIPNTLSYCENIKVMSLQRNNITISSCNVLSSLKELVDLNISCNLFESIPCKFILHIKTLNISNNWLNEIPDEIDLLSNLEVFDVSFNSISFITENICHLNKLRELYLTSNNLSTLPKSIGACPELEILDIRVNQIADISNVFSSEKLKVLKCDYNPIIGVQDSNGQMLSLSFLSLHKTSLTRFNASWNSIKELNISCSKLNELDDSVFSSLLNLEKINLNRNLLSSLPKSLGDLVYLRELSVASNKLSSLPSWIYNLDHLETLDVHHNILKQLPREIWYCRRLWMLNASGNLLSSFPKNPQKVAENKSLSKLDFERDLRDSKAQIPMQPIFLHLSLKELYLGENKLTDDCLDCIAMLKGLEILNLSYNLLDDIGSSLSSLVKLRELYLSGNQLTNAPDDLENLVELKVMMVNHNRLSSLPPEMSKLLKLNILDASWNNLKYNVNNWPYDWNWNVNKELKVLDLSGNHRLEVKPLPNQNDSAIFDDLKKLCILDLNCVKQIPQKLPSERIDLRVRSSLFDDDPVYYSIGETLGPENVFNTWEVVSHNLMNSETKHLWALFKGHKNPNVSKHLIEEMLKSPDCKPILDKEGHLLYKGLSVRMGIHFGTPICQIDDGYNKMDYTGAPVNLASRVMSSADGGQIHISNDAYEEFCESQDKEMLDGIKYVLYDVGLTKLKGFPFPEYLRVIYPENLCYRHQQAMTTSKSTIGVKALSGIFNDPESILKSHHISSLNSIDDKLLEFLNKKFPSPLVESWAKKVQLDPIDSMSDAQLLDAFEELVFHVEVHL